MEAAPQGPNLNKSGALGRFDVGLAPRGTLHTEVILRLLSVYYLNSNLDFELQICVELCSDAPDAGAVEVLKRHRAKQAEEKLKAGGLSQGGVRPAPRRDAGAPHH
jgi:hypothetical protein